MISIRRLRLVTGLVLFVYVTGHLLILGLGLAGIDFLKTAGNRYGALWGSPVGLILLYGSMATHLALAFYALYQRKSLKMRPFEALQMVLGFAIPPMLVLHVISMRIAYELFGIPNDYRILQAQFWNGATANAAFQLTVLLIVWVHGCIGIYYWLRLKPIFAAWRSPLAAACTAVPLIALTGFIASGREVHLRSLADPDWLAATLRRTAEVTDAQKATLSLIHDRFLIAFSAALIATLCLRLLRKMWLARGRRFRMQYATGPTVSAPVGLSILEVSRSRGIPHASVCGGRGRCSTCRVLIDGEPGVLEPPSDDEIGVLQRVKAPPRVRLACQVRPKGDLTVTLLLPPQASLADLHSGHDARQGEERVLAVMFADLRGFTTLSESKLPYDVVFLLNRFAREMAEAVEQNGGHVDKFLGDGIMALFGLSGSADEAARGALKAAQEMERRLVRLNKSIATELPTPLRMGIGLHAGPVIVGEIGYGRATSFTAIGDVVNTASRLEAATKELDATVVVSEALLNLAGETLDDAESREIAVRGRTQQIKVRALGTLSVQAG
ncbi:Adenylate cyclase 1 [Hartmannibacter diazotrophicus]|uniref:Adenylate cyclase 1 n=1 Tax=Hartmannibacter diazotrophicus TaxID=1482074 RepID=A0A2C9D6W5_9HYPH|nr:adenylate/guanylate cyclase domain-containing protein [Hartmannibacter diazotrophicus]SON55491.1 Adenylate cyclase 1 [Hartmannibacter diazotrophicus]